MKHVGKFSWWRLLCLPLLATCALTGGCAKKNKPSEPADTSLVPDVPDEDPYDPSSQYDLEFTLPVVEQDAAKVRPDTWAAVDGLGRTLSGYGDTYTSSALQGKVGEKNEKKFVGIFYSSWHESLAQSNRARNITQLLAKYSEEEREQIKHDFNNKVWAGYTGYHFWDEPIFNYYSTADTYVLRKHAEMLADAGVDAIIFDCTNGDLTWRTSYLAIFETFEKARAEGVKTPQIVFMLNFGKADTTRTMLGELWRTIYRDGKYQDLWFYWDGKPLVMGYPESLKDTATDQEIRDFFTFRRNDASYFLQEGDDTHWGWLSVYPQAAYRHADGSVEQVTVGVAQNADYERNVLTAMSGFHVMGRSYTNGDYSYSYQYQDQTVKVDKSIANSKYYGLNFQQQWDYAISLNPEFIFVTGWNEWVAMRVKDWAGDKTLENCVVDQYDTEYSRDCEPSTGEMKDYYYYQLCENIRRFKGVSKPGQLVAQRTIDITGKTSQWLGLTAYSHYVNSTWERSAANGSTGYERRIYKNEGATTRNDIVTSKVAFDDQNLYFYADAANVLTPYTDEGWMRLFLDTDPTGKSANWEGFEYVINRVNPSSETECTLERSTGGWNWETVATLQYAVKGNVIQICVPRSALGMSEGGAPASFTFKWCDNNLIGDNAGNILDLYTSGEAAPGGRFTFVFDRDRAKVDG